MVAGNLAMVAGNLAMVAGIQAMVARIQAMVADDLATVAGNPRFSRHRRKKTTSLGRFRRRWRGIRARRESVFMRDMKKATSRTARVCSGRSKTAATRHPSRKKKDTMSTIVQATKPNKATALEGVRALIAGTQKRTPNGSLTFGNATYTAASLVQMFQHLADAMTAHDVAQAKTRDVLAALHDVTATVGPVLRAYRRFLVATYGNATETLADYGIKPPKARAPRTSEQKAAAAAKLRATREARGTMSKKQKASIHGAVASPRAIPATPTTPPKPAT
jgi:hypothetical protein